MKKLAAKLWAVLMLILISMQSMATDVFTSNRTDFRDESIYFMITTRFYDGDPKNNVLCWDNQAAQIETKDPCWRGDFQGVIDKLDVERTEHDGREEHDGKSDGKRTEQRKYVYRLCP